MPTRLRACAVCVHEGKLLVVRLKEPRSGRIFPFPPGGQVESGEAPQEAARRETLEETGYEVRIDSNSECVTDYAFQWDGATFQCQTHFFKGHLSEATPHAVKDVRYLVSVEWLPIEDLEDAFEFCEPILKAVQALLRTDPS